MEAGYHDTLECRTVLQTYLIAAAGCVCAMLASVAGNSIFAALLQVRNSSALGAVYDVH